MLKIVHQANQLLKKHYMKILPIYLVIELLMLAVNLIPNQIISIFLGIGLATITHAYAITSLKLTEDKADEITFADCFIGIKSFARLFPSYMMRKVCLNLTSLILLAPALLLVRFRTGFALGEFLDWIRVIVVSGINELGSISLVSDYLTSSALVVNFALSSIITTILSFGLAMIPYLVEKYDIAWNEAILKSWSMMKGQKRNLFILQLYYLPRIMISYALVDLVSAILAFAPLLSILVSILLAIYLPLLFYLPHIEIATALFYQKLISQESHKDLFAI